jgi:DNA-directed RNA polymerase specialized sigma24 family protein
VSQVDEIYRQVQKGSHEAFASWLALCEMQLRKSLQPFATLIDDESVLQEGLERMWLLAPKLKLKGENASLRFALRLMRNLAISEIRRRRREVPWEPGHSDEGFSGPDPPTDPAVMRAIRKCLDKLPSRPSEALLARLRAGPDRELARGVGMKLNAFYKNIGRARKFMEECLRGAGVVLEEYL